MFLHITAAVANKTPGIHLFLFHVHALMIDSHVCNASMQVHHTKDGDETCLST